MPRDYPPPGTFCLYMDESGEFGRARGSSRYFLVTLLCTQSPKALRKRLWKQKAILYGKGWPKSVEIKGASVWGSAHRPGIPKAISENREAHISGILAAILRGDVSVHYSIVRKDRLRPRLFDAEDGILFNWIAGNLISRAYPQHFRGPLSLTVDQRSKETHHKLKFDGYVETKLVAEADHDDGMEIAHCESHEEFGLQAVDFLSWALFRHFEHGDDQFTHAIAPSVGFVDMWYPGKACPGK